MKVFAPKAMGPKTVAELKKLGVDMEKELEMPVMKKDKKPIEDIL